MGLPTQKQFLDTCAIVAPHVHNTPVLTSRLLNEISGAQLYFKCENFQKMGAFKMRGAIAAISQLTSKQKQAGVVTHSSGNFAQAISLAAKNLQIPAHIVMPKNAPSVKMEAVTKYGGKITKVAATIKAREAGAQKIVNEKGATFIHPSNDINVIMGQGTAAQELLEKHPTLNAILTPVGGGGLIAGTAIAAHYANTTCTVIGAEPANVDDAYRSLQSGKIEYNETTNTVADGLRTHLGDINFPIIKQLVPQILLAGEAEIIAAMKMIYQYLKIVIEPSCALPLAVLLANKEQFTGMKVGIILSGGNVDLENLPF